MTVKIDGPRGLVRALAILSDDIQAGIVVSCSLHYEPTHVARISICYVTGREDESELPGLPGLTVESSEQDEITTKR